MAELDRRSDAELTEARNVLLGQELRVLDPRPEPERRPLVTRFLERVERVAVGEVSDRVHGYRPTGSDACAHDLGQLLTARDLDPGAVEQPRGLRAERPVHEHLQIADPEPV